MAFFLFVRSGIRNKKEKKMKNYLIKPFIIIVEVGVEFLLSLIFKIPFNIWNVLLMFTLCEIINFKIELTIRFYIQNEFWRNLVINMISSIIGLLIIDGNISEPLISFPAIVLGIVLKYIILKILEKRVEILLSFLISSISGSNYIISRVILPFIKNQNA
jgi:hypothetical protein